TYSVSPNFPEGYRSNRMIDSAVCAKVRATRALQSAFVHVLDFHDGEALDDRRTENHFCDLSMPEKPELPIVTVSQEETKDFEKSLPVRRTTTTITMPDGRGFQLLGGTAAPLSWIPMPIIGCFRNS
ncbi:hypothetical protein GR268_48725, partial [Rhizobium leguminosarum]|nr:hypothetical protein [Rhizobium leguminosarum]